MARRENGNVSIRIENPNLMVWAEFVLRPKNEIPFCFPWENHGFAFGPRKRPEYNNWEENEHKKKKLFKLSDNGSEAHLCHILANARS